MTLKISLPFTSMKDYAQFLAIKDDAILREVFGEEWILWMEKKINKIEDWVKGIEYNREYMTPKELDEYAETLYS